MSSSNTKTGSDEKVDNVSNTLVSLEDDDEFEDFPAEEAEAEVAIPGGKEHLWEEHWDDDDDADDNFSAQLREELKKAHVNKPSS